MPIVPIICVVALLLGIVAIVMSRDTWKWQNITLASLLLVFGVLFFYLAAKNLKMQESWRNEIRDFKTAVADAETAIEKLRDGDPSLYDYRRDVQSVMYGRGQIWRFATCKAVDPQTGVMQVTIQQPQPPGIAPDSVLFVFDKTTAPEGGLFLGEFEVTEAAGQDISLSPVLPLRPEQIQLLAQRRNRDVELYEMMPTDSPELFAELSPEQRLSLFPNTVPEDVRQAYAKDGAPPVEGETQTEHIWRRVRAVRTFTVSAGAGDEAVTEEVTEGTELVLDPQSAEERIAAGDVAPVEGNDKVFRRDLRDFVRLFRDLNLRIDAKLRNQAELNQQIAVVEEAQKKVAANLAYRKEENAKLTSDLERYQQEGKRIAQHVEALEKEIARINAEIAQKREDNLRLEEELTRYSYEIANRLRNPVATTP